MFKAGWYRPAVMLTLGAVATLGRAATLPDLQVLDETGQAVADAVLVVEGARPLHPPEAVEEVVIDQRDLAFVPEVTVIRVGTRVRFPNSDETRHHVYSFSEAKSFELQLYRGNEAPPVAFDRPGRVALGCNIHDAMRGYIYVVETPLHAKTDASGRARLPAIANAEDGRLVVRHPQLDESLSLAVDDLMNSEGVREIRLPLTLAEPESGSEPSSLRDRLRSYGNDDD